MSGVHWFVSSPSLVCNLLMLRDKTEMRKLAKIPAKRSNREQQSDGYDEFVFVSLQLHIERWESGAVFRPSLCIPLFDLFVEIDFLPVP